MLNPRLGLVVLGVYAVLLIVGGVMGYVKARSRASLIAGVVSGLIAVGAVVISRFYNEDGGYSLGLLLAIAMFVFFAPRAMTARKFMPMGMMSVASAVVIGVMVWSIAI
jgi:uncharacterized membrane protein (UPF0136 family)